MGPVFQKRCDSMLAHINLVGKVNDHNIHDDDYKVVHRLRLDNKIKMVMIDNSWYYVSINAKPYVQSDASIDPVAFYLASINPDNEHFVKVYRKNFIVPELPEFVVDAELDSVL